MTLKNQDRLTAEQVKVISFITDYISPYVQAIALVEEMADAGVVTNLETAERVFNKSQEYLSGHYATAIRALLETGWLSKIRK